MEVELKGICELRGLDNKWAFFVMIFKSGV